MKFKNRASWMLFDAPKDGGAPSSDVQAPPPTEPTTPPTPPTGEKMLPQSEVNRIVKERLREQEDRDKQKKQREDGKYQELSETLATDLETHKGKLTETEGKVATLTTELETYKKLVQTMIKDQRKLVPAHFLTILDELPELRQAEWLAQNSDKLGTVANDQPKQVPGVPPSPKPQGQQGGLSIVDQYIQNRNKQAEGPKNASV